MKDCIDLGVETFDPERHFPDHDPGFIQVWIHQTFGPGGRFERPVNALNLALCVLPVMRGEEEVYRFVSRVTIRSCKCGFRVKEQHLTEEEWCEISLRWMMILCDDAPWNRGTSIYSGLWLAQRCFDANPQIPRPPSNEMHARLRLAYSVPSE